MIFQGGTDVPAIGTPAYAQASQGSGPGIFVKDPATGAYTLTPGSDMTPISNSSGRSVSDLMGTTPSSAQDSYGIFATNLTAMLKKAQTVGNPTPLLTQKNQLQNEQVGLANPTTSILSPFFNMESPSQSTASQGQTQNIFSPGITAITDQVNAANALLTNTTNSMNTAAELNKPQPVSPGQSLVSPTGTVTFQGHSYTPAINPTTGLPDFIDTVTGQYASNQNLNAATSGSSPLVGGVDFSGTATSTGAYAADPNYAKEVGGIYTALQANMPQASAQGLDQYIQGHAAKSPVTGQMIINAATQYGVDPLLLTSVLAQESDFGTAGVGATTNNPGNVGNTGTSTKAFNSWQAGVAATAAELAKRMPGNPNAPQTPATAPKAPQATTSPVGGQFSTDASARVAKIPTYLRSYVDAGPMGVAYIDDDRVPDTTVGGMKLKDVLRSQAAAAGIPYLMASDASAVKSLGVVYQSLNNMKDLVDGTLISSKNYGIFASPTDWLRTNINNVFGNEPQLSKFNSYRDTAIKAVQGLAGGSGSGLRINASEIEANVNNLPTSGDNVETAYAKLSGLETQLNTQLAATFPYITTQQPGANGGPTSGTGSSSGTTSNGVDLTQFNQ